MIQNKKNFIFLQNVVKFPFFGLKKQIYGSSS